MKKSHRGRIVGASIAIFVSVAILVSAGWLLINRQYAADAITVWAYTAPSNIVDIEETVDFTEKGSFYFRTTQPEILAAKDFNIDCPRQEPGSPILGCYSMGRIYIYDITDERLEGIEEVTAAHEMLHAVWERMDVAEQDRIAGLLRAVYNEQASPELQERIAYYERNQPGEIDNELHSILSTELRTLTPELEDYYAEYFADRQKVVSLHENYSRVFNALSARSEALYGELLALSESIEVNTATYNQSVAQLSRDITTFNARANNGSFDTMAQFNQERASLVSRSAALEALRVSISNDIASYNIKYDEYTAVAGEIDGLNRSLDSITELQEAPAL